MTEPFERHGTTAHDGYMACDCRGTGFIISGVGRTQDAAPAPDFGSLDMNRAGPWILGQMKIMGCREFLMGQMTKPIETTDDRAWADLIVWLLGEYDKSNLAGGYTKARPCPIHTRPTWGVPKSKVPDKTGRKGGDLPLAENWGQASKRGTDL